MQPAFAQSLKTTAAPYYTSQALPPSQPLHPSPLRPQVMHLEGELSYLADVSCRPQCAGVDVIYVVLVEGFGLATVEYVG